MNQVTICEDILHSESWQTFECENLCEFLMTRYPAWPKSARIYHRHVAESADVTPSDDATVDRLHELTGHFFVVIYPEPFWVFIVIAIVIAVAAIAVAFLLRPSSTPNLKNNQQESSPNNALADRQNSERINQRIPDIFGEVQSIPDLIGVPYKIFRNSQEIEIAYMCIGRGSYVVDGSRIYDDATPIASIAGATVEVYGPNTSPNSGDAPVLRVGTAIGRPVVSVKKSASINGQTLLAPNTANFVGNANTRFVYPDTIQVLSGGDDFTKRFAAGDVLNVVGSAVDPGGAHGPYDMAGAYTILSVTTNAVVLSAPAAVNANWNLINAYTGSVSTYGSPNLYTSGPRWVGPFIFNVEDMNKLLLNFVAQNGLYKDDGTNQFALNVSILVGVQAVDSNNTPIGSELYATAVIEGSSTQKTQRAVTLEIALPLAGPCQVRVQRTTPADLTFKGSVIDVVQWRDMYAISPVVPLHFGNVTTIYSQTYATAGALSIQERKLNLIVTRKIPSIIDASIPSFTAPVATKRVDDIIVACAIDPYIGNRQLAELDIVGITATRAAIEAYFGTTKVSEFCYTFDDSKVSFEESLADIAASVFCTAYRRGSIISLFFEKQTVNSVMLFNHRNKIPKSETRTVTFGMPNEFNGIELDFINPNSPTFKDVDAHETLYFPPDMSATNPKKVGTIGVRNKVQATLIGWRYFNKLKYQNTAVQFTATQESALRIINERILVADNTRADTQDGEVIAQNVLLLTLSQPVKFQIGLLYTIFLQHYDDTVESIAITAGPNANQVVLGIAPVIPLVIEQEAYARTTYMIVSNAPQRATAFLLAEKAPQKGLTYDLKAINYDDRYYAHDNDFTLGLLTDAPFVPANYPTGYAAGAGYPGPTGGNPGGADPPGVGDNGGGSGGSGGSGGGEIRPNLE